MSEIKVNSIKGVGASAAAITVNNTDGTCTANITSVNGGQLGNRNLLMNGDMQISQRNGDTSVAVTGNVYTLDRWQVVNDAGSSKFTVQQVDDAPVGLKKSLKMTSSSAYSVPATEAHGIGQKIEGLNANQLMFGSSDAKSITISFFVKSSLTGTFSGSVLNEDMFRGYPWTYTINSADTWEYKTVTVAGSQDGTWLLDNREGMRIFWNIGSGTSRSGTAGQWSTAQYTFGATGATSVVGTNAATLQITGCQVEEGSVATDFEHRSYGQELALCQRYYFLYLEGNNKEIGAAWYYTASHASFFFRFPVPMRAVPTGTDTTGTDYYTIYRNGGSDGLNSVAFENGSTEQYSAYNSGSASGTAGQCGLLRSTNVSAKIAFSAEL